MVLPSPVRVVIVDDQIAIRTDAATLLKQQDNFIVIGSCGSVQEALILIPATEPDLLLLDITLGDGTGFDILEKLSPFRFKVIFLTAHHEYALRAIKVGALDYLLKPINQHELQQALAKVIPANEIMDAITQSSYQRKDIPERIVLRSQQFIHAIELNEIIYCHSNAGYTTFYLTNERKILTSRHLKEYEEILPSSMFLRTHQSYLVNNRFIDKYQKEDGYLVLREGTEIPVATRRNSEILEYFNHIR
jgi:two-component system LytT family response regulator